MNPRHGIGGVTLLRYIFMCVIHLIYTVLILCIVVRCTKKRNDHGELPGYQWPIYMINSFVTYMYMCVYVKYKDHPSNPCHLTVKTRDFRFLKFLYLNLIHLYHMFILLFSAREKIFMYGHISPDMTIFGWIWSYMAISGYVWQ